MKKLAVISCCLLLAACIGSGPGKALHEVASSLERKDSTAFLAKMDMQRYASAYVDNLTRGNSALRAIDDAASKLFGLGVSDMVKGISSMESELTNDFQQRVSTGELVNECSQAASTSCPWVPAALRAAKVKELDDKAAIAHVTVPGNIATWLALAKDNSGAWKIVGFSPQENAAAAQARAGLAPPKPAPAPPPPANKKPEKAPPKTPGKGTTI